MVDSLRQRLTLLGYSRLEAAVGGTIASAVRTVYETGRESVLADLLVQKTGNEIFRDSSLRSALIADASTDELEKLALTVKDVAGLPKHSLRLKLLEYYGRNYTERKQRAFLSAFGFSEQYFYRPIKDVRESNLIAGPTSDEQSTRLYPLHDYQWRIKRQMHSLFLNTSAPRSIVHMPTGAGKTATAVEFLIDKIRSSENASYIWIVDSSELAEQALQAFIKTWMFKGDRLINVGRFFGEFESEVVEGVTNILFCTFAKVHSALSDRNGKSLAKLKRIYSSLCGVIVDEAHTSVAETYRYTINSLVGRSSVFLIGLSATPGRNTEDETTALRELYHGRIISIQTKDGEEIKDAIAFLTDNKFLARLNYEEFEGATSDAIDENTLNEELASNSVRNSKIISKLELLHKESKSTIVFACSLDHVFALLALCRKKDLSCAAIVGTTSSSERENYFKNFKNGSIKILINFNILSTGVDFPNLDCVFLTRPMSSPIFYSQVVGRALRGPKNGGKPENTIINIRDNLRNFPISSVLFESFKRTFQGKL